MKTNIYNINMILRSSWRCYKFFAIIFFSGFIVLVVFLAFRQFMVYVKLPNGITMTQSLIRDTGDNGFVLNNENNKFLLTAEFGEIAWEGDYVFGLGSPVKSDTKTGDSFIYKRGWPEARIFNSDAKRRSAMRKYGLRGSIDYPPDILKDASYMSCLEKRGRVECRNHILENYWKARESGKEKPYQCKEGALKPCHSYSIYKTYLSLIRMKEYQRKRYE